MKSLLKDPLLLFLLVGALIFWLADLVPGTGSDDYVIDITDNDRYPARLSAKAPCNCTVAWVLPRNCASASLMDHRNLPSDLSHPSP